MNQDSTKEPTIGEIVANNFSAASLFKKEGIDFCCGGKKSLTQACEEKGLDPLEIVKKLIALEQIPVQINQNFKEWKLDFLCEHIMKTHHVYVLKTLPELVFYTQKIASVHGEHHPELIEVANLFARVNAELLQHLQNEEEVLFPAILKLMTTHSSEAKELIISEIARMQNEHEFAGETIDHINELTQNYRIPEDGCNTYRVTFKLLEQFEDDLHIHVHLENNILYPKALKLAE